MTLNQVWRDCLRMWKWIAKVWKPGMDVDVLKKEWMGKWMPGVDVYATCFFCHYDRDNACSDICGSCPPRLVSKRFCCGNTTYHYLFNPKKFCQKLLQLDAKRRSV